MITYTKKAGTTDVSVVIRIVDSADGTPETAVDYNTSGIDLWYRREGAAVTSITEAALAALTTAHTDGGIEHIGNGYYRLDLPDAACASGAAGVMVGGTVTGMIVIGCYVQLVAYDPTDTVRLGLTALPNAAAEAAGGLYTRGTGAGQINQTVNGLINSNVIDIDGVAVSTTTAHIGVNVVQISGDSTSADNLESYTDGTTPMPVNVTQISGDGTAADNLESYCDGTTPQPVNITHVISDPIQASSSKTTNWGGTP